MHEIQVLIGGKETTEAFAATCSEALRRELTSELFMIPLTEALVLQMTSQALRLPDLEDPDEAKELASALQPVVTSLLDANLVGRLGVVLTQYFGGSGNQAALLVENGTVSHGPFVGEGSINRILARLGVCRDDKTGRDEFAVVGLDRWRSSDQIIGGAG
ncbi:MAG: hypothetical protein SF187_12905 [Deltaproteobacteria bacterium]|nr:hypothetical protein [Deltaproteobacteria bacterium]